MNLILIFVLRVSLGARLKFVKICTYLFRISGGGAGEGTSLAEFHL